jgi:hypothetical protein
LFNNFVNAKQKDRLDVVNDFNKIVKTNYCNRVNTPAEAVREWGLRRFSIPGLAGLVICLLSSKFAA